MSKEGHHMRYLQALVLVGVLQPNVQAESFFPLADQRVVSDNGRYYVVLKRQRPAGSQVLNRTAPIEMTICEQAPNTKPVRPAYSALEPREDKQFTIVKDSEVRVRAGDLVLGETLLREDPGDVLVSSRGNGVALLDRWAHNNTLPTAGPAVTILSNKGRVQHQLELRALFSPAEIDSFRWSPTRARIEWLEAGWMDDETKELVVIGRLGIRGPFQWPFSIVDLETGKVRQGGFRDVARIVVNGNADVRRVAVSRVAECIVHIMRRKDLWLLPSVRVLRAVLRV